jgi:hypothetical protein
MAPRRAEGREWFTLTPEFGPPEYMPCLPFTRQPVADAWEVNVEFLGYPRQPLQARASAPRQWGVPAC